MPRRLIIRGVSLRDSSTMMRSGYRRAVIYDISRVNADPVRLQQVRLNALTKATSYTPPDGDIHVNGHVSDSHLMLRVRDSGEGISAEDLPRIFGLFTRPEGRHDTGFGVGLAVARSLVELHGGTIEAAAKGDLTAASSESRSGLLDHVHCHVNLEDFAVHRVGRGGVLRRLTIPQGKDEIRCK